MILGSAKLFSEGSVVNILNFVGHAVSAATTNNSRRRTAAVDNV